MQTGSGDCARNTKRGRNIVLTFYFILFFYLIVVPHFDNDHLRNRPVYTDDSSRPQQTANATPPQPACSQELNIIEHLWVILGRMIHPRNPPIQTVAELEVALNQELALIPQETVQRLIARGAWYKQ